MSDSYAPYLVEELKIHGVKDWEIDGNGKHNKLRFRWNDRLYMHVFPKTPSDWHGVKNSLSDLRRQMGVRRIIRKSEGRERRRNHTCPKQNLKITVQDSPFAVLADLGRKEIVLCPRLTLAQMAAMLNSVMR